MNISFNSNVANLKVRRQKFGLGSLIFLMLFGAGFAASGFFIFKQAEVDPSWVKVSGQIVGSSSYAGSGSTTYAAVVKYEVNGQTYQVTSSSSSSFYPHIGDTRQVAYNPSQPDEAKVVGGAGSVWWLYLFPVVGVACLIIAPVAYVKSLRRNSDIHRLMQAGQKIQGVLTDIQTSPGTNNNSTYKIVVSATDSAGTVQNYVSDSLTGIGGLAMADFRNSPIPIDVYIDPTNPKDYYIDISEIPNLTPERIADLIKSAVNRKSSMFAQGEQPNQVPPSPLSNTANPTKPDNNNFMQPPQQPLS